MRQSWKFQSILALILLVALNAVVASAQTKPVRRITQPVDDSQRSTLRGNTYPLALAQFDRGAAPGGLAMDRMLLILKRSPEQQAALDVFLGEQQDATSPNFHKWLSPEEFGTVYGPSDEDIQIVTAWLQSQGFVVGPVTKGKTALEFSGTAAQVQHALGTPIHRFVIDHNEHWANTTDPEVPSALTPVIAGIASLHNFRKEGQNSYYGIFSRSPHSAVATPVKPLFTFPGGCDNLNNCYGVGPYDFATIYNLKPLWDGGLDGSGQTIAIVGRTNINVQDTRDFRSVFGLPVNDPQVILNGPDPGINGDESEANIDVQWSGAAAPRARIKFVTSASTETTDGVDLSALYIVDNNVAGIMSASYGLCELGMGTSGNLFYKQLWEQAAAQGITVFVSTGDNGSAGCDVFRGTVPQPAQFGLAVNGLSSTPFNVAVGGTDFNQFTNPLLYWNTTNDPTTHASAKGYIPETTWNSSCTNQLWASAGLSSNPETNCNDSRIVNFVTTVGGSGGASNCTVNSQTRGSCSGGYPKPSWQTGAGIPSDGKRDTPDVSLFSSSGFLGSFYVVCQSDLAGPCNLDAIQFGGFGGTSVASPAFAGIMALVNQNANARQGNANYVLYRLAAQSGASCTSAANPASTCVFNDVTIGTIAQPCLKGTPNCTVNTASHQFGVLSGHAASAAYDLATGLGTVNAANLVNKWSTVTGTFRPSSTTLTLNSGNPVNITHGASVGVNIGVAPASGTGTPSGDVSLVAENVKGVQQFTLSGGAVSGSTALLPGGTYNVTAHYAGDGTFGGSDSAPVSVTVGKEDSKTTVSFVTFDDSGNILSSNASTAVYGSPYLLRVNVTNTAGGSCTSSPVACPSGPVSIADNGLALDGGAFPLNSFGYTEDQLVNLAGGSHNVQAQYGGDSSFNSSTGTAPITISPAPIAFIGPVVVSNVAVASSSQIQANLQAHASGVAPTGTVTFVANSVPLTGIVNYSSSGSSPGSSLVSFQANFFGDASAFPTPGNYAVTARYSGDANYTSADAPVTNLSLKFPTPAVSVQPSSYEMPPGNLTLTATVISSSTTIRPTGTLTFTPFSTNTAINDVSYMPVSDSSGHLNLQGTITIPVTVGDRYSVAYSGDVNYPASQGGTGVAVTGTDFTLTSSVGSVTVVRGQGAMLNLTVGLQSGAAPVVFSASPCSGLPAESTCTVGPSTVSYTSNLQLSVITTGPHPRTASVLPNNHAVWWMAVSAPGLLGIVLLGALPKSRRILHGCALIAVLLLVCSCGGGTSGGGGGGGNTDPGTPPGSYVITVTGTSGTITHTTTFTLIVQ